MDEEVDGAVEVVEEPKVEKARHIGVCRFILKLLPSSTTSLEVNRMTIVFFAVSSLDVMDSLSVIDKQRASIIEWVYSQQITTKSENGLCAGGFRGGPSLGRRYENNERENIPLDYSHIANTYTALVVLLILGDDLSRVDRAAIIAGLRNLQRPDGSFAGMFGGSENDMRFLYCACVISHIINDWSGVDIDRAVDFVKRSHRYDYGIAQGPGQEAHGGSTYCAVASLKLMGRLHDGLLSIDRTRVFLLQRQLNGFNGRPNKLVDTCYAFWVGSTIKMLDGYHFVDTKLLRQFVFSCQQSSGGFSKWPESNSDPLHTYFGLCGLSIAGEPGLLEIDPALDMTIRTVALIKQSVFYK